MYSPVTVSETRNLLRGFQIENLKARLVLCEIAETGFTNKIRSLHTTPEQRIDAIRCRRQILLEQESVLQQLTALVGRSERLDGAGIFSSRIAQRIAVSANERVHLKS